MRARQAGSVVSLLGATCVIFWVWVTPANKYAFDGPTTTPPDPDTVLVLVILSVVAFVLAAVATWLSLCGTRRGVRLTIMTIATCIEIYALVRLFQALPYWQG